MKITIYYDTEFTDLSPDASLITIGFITEAGDELYIELTDGWTKDECSCFVCEEVLPLLGLHNPELLTRAAAAARIEAWFHELRAGDQSIPIECLSDSTFDWQHLLELFPWEPGKDPWSRRYNVVGRLVQNEVPSSSQFEKALNDLTNHEEQHHALIDARAIKLATEACYRLANRGTKP